MRLKGGMRPKKFQMGGGAGGTAFLGGLPGAGGPTDPSGVAAAQDAMAKMFWNRATPQQQQQMTAQGVQDPRGGGAPGGSSMTGLPPVGPSNAQLAAGTAPNPLAQQQQLRGAMPSPGGAPGGGGVSPLPGGGPPGAPLNFTPGPGQNAWRPDQMQAVGNPNSPWAPANFPGNPNNPSWAAPDQQAKAAALFQQQGGGAGVGGPPPGGGPPGGGMMPRPGMGWGAPPGAGPMGAPPGGGGSLAGMSGVPGSVPGGLGPGGLGPMQQQALMGSLAGRGSGAPGGGMPGAGVGMMGAPVGAPGGAPGGGGGMSPQIAAMLQANPGLVGAGMGFAEGGHVEIEKGSGVSKFNSTKAAPGNLATHPGKAKMAKGGVLKRKPKALKAKAKEDRKSPSPVMDPTDPDYDTPTAGAGGWPPTPNFGGTGSGANVPPPVPAPSAMAKGGDVEDGGGVKDLDSTKGAPGNLPTRPGKAKMAKGGKFSKGGEKVKDSDCDKMAAGGVAKRRRGFPNTIGAPKKMAEGGSVRGGGIAERGKKFSGIY